MQPKIIYVKDNKDETVSLTKFELERLVAQAYEAGKSDASPYPISIPKAYTFPSDATSVETAAWSAHSTPTEFVTLKELHEYLTSYVSTYGGCNVESLGAMTGMGGSLFNPYVVYLATPDSGEPLKLYLPRYK